MRLDPNLKRVIFYTNRVDLYLIVYFFTLRCRSKKSNIASSARLGVLALEAVAGPFQRQQLRLDAGRLQAVDDPDGLLVGDVVVLRCRGCRASARRSGVTQ